MNVNCQFFNKRSDKVDYLRFVVLTVIFTFPRYANNDRKTMSESRSWMSDVFDVRCNMFEKERAGFSKLVGIL